jgi:tetratricopeptide (TPR) repeat protein
MATQRRTLRQVIDSRQQSTFVGRQDELALFKENLGYEADDQRRHWFFNIHGPAGVGKTFLVRQWIRIAKETGTARASVPDTVGDVLKAMATIAVTLGRQGVPLKGFQARYQVYEQRCGELLADTGIPKETASRWTKDAVRLALRAAREVPGMNVAAAVLDDPAVAEGADQLRKYLVERLRKDEDVRLLLSPTEELSPLFIEDLREFGPQRQLTLFVDGYERTGKFLDPWLLDLLDGHYGELPEALTLTIAGQNPLDANRWAPYHGLLADVPLEPFTEPETRELLAQHGVTNERVIEVIQALSGGLPMWVASLAASHPDNPEAVADASDSTGEHLLRWETDPLRRQVALEVALARWFNRDLLAALRDAEMAEQLWDWLRTRPFVSNHPAGYQYLSVVRAPLLGLYRRQSPEAWRQRHQILADHHSACRDALGIQDQDGWADPVWQRHALEATYHQLCSAPQAHLADALDQVLRAFEAEPTLTYRWIEAIQQAGTDSDAPGVRKWGKRLRDALTGDDNWDWVGLVTLLLDQGGLAEQRRIAAFCARGELHREASRPGLALADFDRALRLRRDDDRSLAGRGVTFLAMGRHDDAVRDLSSAIKINPRNAWATAHRGQAYLAMGRYGEAVDDFDKAIEIDPGYAWAIAHRGETYRLTGRLGDAVADFDKAIRLDPGLDWVITNRDMALSSMAARTDAQPTTKEPSSASPASGDEGLLADNA